MSSSTLSLLGLYTWDNTIFDNMALPDEIDAGILIDNLLMEAAELEVLYADPDVMKAAIEVWSQRRLHTWERMETVLYENYDPFVNINQQIVNGKPFFDFIETYVEIYINRVVLLSM